MFVTNLTNILHTTLPDTALKPTTPQRPFALQLSQQRLRIPLPSLPQLDLFLIFFDLFGFLYLLLLVDGLVVGWLVDTDG